MNQPFYQRTAALLGNDAVEKIKNARLLVLGTGGVGGYAAEQLCRAGVGNITLIDGDDVEPTNCNRQIAALNSTIGLPKAEVLCARFKDINPEGIFTPEVRFIKPEECDELLETPFNAVLETIDDVPAKVAFLKSVANKKIPCVSVMGAGGKMDISQIKTADISKTFGDPLARKVRSELRKLGITKGIQTIFSPEPRCQIQDLSTIGTISYMPAAFGCHAAAAILKCLLE
jgi:tRNA A37 threonylcarbamoyladenosine dehydratase